MSTLGVIIFQVLVPFAAGLWIVWQIVRIDRLERRVQQLEQLPIRHYLGIGKGHPRMTQKRPPEDPDRVTPE